MLLKTPKDRKLPKHLNMWFHIHLCMANMTLSIPDSVHTEMKNFPEIRWSEIARRAIVERIEMLTEVEKIAKKSKLTRKDAEKFGDMVKKEATKKLVHDHSIRL